MAEGVVPVARNFALLLAELEDGALLRDLTEETKDVCAELEQMSQMKGRSAAKGKLTLTLEITAKEGVIEVIPTVTTKTPKMSRSRSIFWRGRDGVLVRSNPDQPDLPLRDVSARAGELRNVS